MVTTHTLIIGASAAGLACAACLQKLGIEYIVVEKHAQVATKWRNHYDRLHLHTSKKWSALPFKKMDTALPKYPSREQVVSYLDDYAKDLNIYPVFNSEVLSLKKVNHHWVTETKDQVYQSTFVIIATGLNHTPKLPALEGMDTFKGKIIHSSAYKNGATFTGQRVLVVGFGNSACEQALCLYEHGAIPFLSVRSAVNVLPREIAGFPVLELGKLTYLFPTWLADKINGPLIRLLVGDITKLGLKKSVYGPREQIEKQKKIPMLDIGIIKLIKQGHVKVFGDIERLDGNTVYFEDNRQQEVDAIVLATGYRHNLESLIPPGSGRIEDLKNDVSKQSLFGEGGLYCCGFYVSPMGMLREIGNEAKKIAKDIAGKLTAANA